MVERIREAKLTLHVETNKRTVHIEFDDLTSLTLDDIERLEDFWRGGHGKAIGFRFGDDSCELKSDGD